MDVVGLGGLLDLPKRYSFVPSFSTGLLVPGTRASSASSWSDRPTIAAARGCPFLPSIRTRPDAQVASESGCPSSQEPRQVRWGYFFAMNMMHGLVWQCLPWLY